MKKLILICSVIMFLGGCGYTTRSMVSSKYKTIRIDQFVNKIDITQEGNTANKYKVYRPTIETDVTRAVSDRYLFDGSLKPVKTNEDADLILKGEVVGFQRDALRYNQNDEVEEYRINVVVNLKMWDNVTNEQLWQENKFTGSQTYYTSGQYMIPESQAINEAIDDLARRIIERTIDQWQWQ